MRILLLEDDPKIASELWDCLSDEGFAVDVAASHDHGRVLARGGDYDAILIGLRSTGRRGFATCRQLRRRGMTTPILLLAPPSSSPRKAAGLDAGADDFLSRPFEPCEMLARVRAIMRRGASETGARLRYHDLKLDLSTHLASRGSRRFVLTPREFALLEYFLRNPDRILTRKELAAHVWGSRTYHDSNTIEVFISMLRRKIDRGRERQLIRTVIGFGYMLSKESPTPPKRANRLARPAAR